MEILEDAKIYARLSYYFDDKDYVSIDTGVRFYNELMLALAKTLEMPFLEGLYIRVKEVDDLEEKEVRETLHFGNVSCDFCVRRECEVKDDILYPKVILDFYDLDDPNAVCKVVLFDEHLKGKSRPIVFPLNKTPRMSKAFHFALGHESLGAHSSASLGVRIAISHRVSSLHNGKSRVSIKSDVAEALLDVYLLPKIKK